MGTLSVEYMGLTLRSPFIASSSGLTSRASFARRLDDAGIGAVVLKSLFEEQIAREASLVWGADQSPEALDYINGYIQGNALDGYISLVKECKEQLSVPVIASISCTTPGEWVQYALALQEAGADALEVNAFILPVDPSSPPQHYEEQYMAVAARLVRRLSMPVSFKLPRALTSPLYTMEQLRQRGVRAAVLFNRFYEPDVRLSEMTLDSAPVFSHGEEYHPTLRWLALASAQVGGLDLSVSSGVHSGEAAAKAIACGATTVQLCSVLYHKGPDHLKVLTEELERALEQTGCSSVKELCGKLSHIDPQRTAIFERSQFMKYFSRHEEPHW